MTIKSEQSMDVRHYCLKKAIKKAWWRRFTQEVSTIVCLFNPLWDPARIRFCWERHVTLECTEKGTTTNTSPNCDTRADK